MGLLLGIELGLKSGERRSLFQSIQNTDTLGLHCKPFFDSSTLFLTPADATIAAILQSPARSPAPTTALRSSDPPALPPPTQTFHDQASSCTTTSRWNRERAASLGSALRCRTRTPRLPRSSPDQNDSWPAGTASQSPLSNLSPRPSGTLALFRSGSASIQFPNQLCRPLRRTACHQPDPHRITQHYLRCPHFHRDGLWH